MAAQQGPRRSAQAGRPRQVGTESAGSECLLQLDRQRDRFPGRLSCSRRTSASTADPAINYGAIGATIGHEIGHGFDDKGSRYDGTGTLNNWWTDEDRATFEKLGKTLVAQYSKVCPIDDGKTCINGQLTLGENIGDLGGISMAYRAYKLSLERQAGAGDQRPHRRSTFFISYAQHQRGSDRDDALRQQMQTDPHSPDFARVNEVCATSTPGTRRSMSSPATRCTCRRTNASWSGEPAGI